MKYTEQWMRVKHHPVFPLSVLILFAVMLIWAGLNWFHPKDGVRCGSGSHWVEQLQTCVGDSNDGS